MATISLYSASSGLNTVLDPQRLKAGYDNQEGVTELSQAVNVSIDDRGLVSLREGYIAGTAGEFHSLFCDGGDCFVVQERTEDAAIMRVLPDLSLLGVRSGLTKNRRMAWCQANADTFYSNGLQNGFIREGVSSPWPTGNYTGPDDNREFPLVAPVATHIAFRPGGQVVIAVDDALYINHEPFQYGLFSLRSGFIRMQSDVVMLVSVRDGIFVSDGERTWFFRKLDGWYNYKQELVAAYPAVSGGLATNKINLADIGFNAPGFAAVWLSTTGICYGLDDGTLVNATEDRVTLPVPLSSGACLVKGTTIISSAA